MVTPACRTLCTAIAITSCLLAAGCTSSKPAANTSAVGSRPATVTSGPASSPAGAAATTAITIKNFGYTVSGSAHAGSTVRVTNKDSVAHTVTADSGQAFDVTVQPGQTATFTAPATAGSYKFHCTFHSTMHGMLTVSS